VIAFDELGISEASLDALGAAGYADPTEFQRVAIPPLLSRRDLLARIDAGADRQAVLALPAIERVLADGPAYNATALILLPTRELAIQTHEEVFQLSALGANARVVGAFEGKPLTSQIGPLKHGTDIVVGTPGRVLEHVKRRTLRIEQLKMIVLDRVDEMIERRLTRDLESIFDSTPKTRQTILLTGITSPRALAFGHRHLRDPELIGIEREEFDSLPEPEGPATPVNIYFGLGKGAKITPRDLVGAITNEGGLDGDLVGAIKIKQNFSLVAVPAEDAEEIVRKLRPSLIKGRKTKIRLERFQMKKPPENNPAGD